MATVRCPTCGTSTRFAEPTIARVKCGECGEWVAVPKPLTTMRCQRCGTSNAVANPEACLSRCTECGELLVDPLAEMTHGNHVAKSASQPKSRQGRRTSTGSWRIVLFVCGVVVAALLIAVLVFSQKLGHRTVPADTEKPATAGAFAHKHALDEARLSVHLVVLTLESAKGQSSDERVIAKLAQETAVLKRCRRQLDALGPIPDDAQPGLLTAITEFHAEQVAFVAAVEGFVKNRFPKPSTEDEPALLRLEAATSDFGIALKGIALAEPFKEFERRRNSSIE
jgi:ribosomal protein S27E